MTVKNLWGNITLICGCHDEKNIELTPNEKGNTLFYSCPKYYSTQRTLGEKACLNRVSMDDYLYVVEHIGIVLFQSSMERKDLTGFEFSKRNVKYKVISHDTSNDRLVVSVYNKASFV